MSELCSTLITTALPETGGGVDLAGACGGGGGGSGGGGGGGRSGGGEVTMGTG